MTTGSVLQEAGAWHGFAEGSWRTSIDVADFVRRQPHTLTTVTPPSSAGPTERTSTCGGRLSGDVPRGAGAGHLRRRHAHAGRITSPARATSTRTGS